MPGNERLATLISFPGPQHNKSSTAAASAAQGKQAAADKDKKAKAASNRGPTDAPAEGEPLASGGDERKHEGLQEQRDQAKVGSCSLNRHLHRRTDHCRQSL